MAYNYGLNFNYSSSLFSSRFASNNYGVNSLASLVGQHNSIRTGSYSRLLRHYYEKQPNSSNSEISTPSNLNNSDTKLSSLKSEADELKASASTLKLRGTNSIFNKTVKKDPQTGEETFDYDYDNIAKQVSNFVDDYNNLLDSSLKQDNTSILQKTVFLTKMTKSNEKQLNAVGITIGTDNKLSVDTTKLKSSDITDLKDLFQGTNSFADKVSTRASDLSRSIMNQMLKSPGSYTNKGNYNTFDTSGYQFDYRL